MTSYKLMGVICSSGYANANSIILGLRVKHKEEDLHSYLSNGSRLDQWNFVFLLYLELLCIMKDGRTLSYIEDHNYLMLKYL